MPIQRLSSEVLQESGCLWQLYRCLSKTEGGEVMKKKWVVCSYCKGDGWLPKSEREKLGMYGKNHQCPKCGGTGRCAEEEKQEVKQ